MCISHDVLFFLCEPIYRCSRSHWKQEHDTGRSGHHTGSSHFHQSHVNDKAALSLTEDTGAAYRRASVLQGGRGLPRVTGAAGPLFKSWCQNNGQKNDDLVVMTFLVRIKLECCKQVTFRGQSSWLYSPYLALRMSKAKSANDCENKQWHAALCKIKGPCWAVSSEGACLDTSKVIISVLVMGKKEAVTKC